MMSGRWQRKIIIPATNDCTVLLRYIGSVYDGVRANELMADSLL